MRKDNPNWLIRTGSYITIASMFVSACRPVNSSTQDEAEESGNKIQETSVPKDLLKEYQKLQATQNALQTQVSELQTKKEVPTIVILPTPTLTPAKFTVESPTTRPTTAIPLDTLTPTPNPDDKILKDVRENSGGEQITLNDVLITYVVKIPRPFTGDAIYAVFGVNTPTGTKGLGLIENFNCELTDLEKNDLLGSPLGSDKSPAISGIWEINKRFETINTRVFVEQSAGTIPVLTSESHKLDEDDSLTACPKDSIFSGAGDLPRAAAKKAGELIREIIEGFKDGYFDYGK
ncbi:MAG TPA: hypothetical protein VI819_04995 [Patescibacteria group bacterium]|nr:hypothetical protein [Patescibacteria group bacterium]